MEVNKIAAHIRYSKDIGGSWKSVELGAEATVSDREHWKQSQSELYYQLAGQLQSLWSNGSNNSNGANSQNGAESHVEPLPEHTPRSGVGKPIRTLVRRTPSGHLNDGLMQVDAAQTSTLQAMSLLTHWREGRVRDGMRSGKRRGWLNATLFLMPNSCTQL